MGKLIFIGKNIVYSFTSEKNLTILILLGMVVCNTIFFVFGNVFWSDSKIRDYQIYENNIVTLQFDSLNIPAFLERTDEEDFVTSVFFEHTALDDSGTLLTIAAYDPIFIFPGAGIQSGNNLSGRSRECAISSSFVTERRFSDLPFIKMGDYLHFLDNDWECIGILTTSAADKFDVVINMDDFQSYVRNNITANFRFRNKTSLIELRDFANSLQAEFHAAYVTLPSKTVSTSYREFLSDMSGTLLLLIIAIINYMFLYRFLLAKKTYVYGIYKAYGMNHLQAISMLCAEFLTFLVLSYTVSILLYFGGVSLIGQAGTISEHIPEFIFAFFTIIIMNLFFGGIAAIKLICNPPMKLIKESVVI